MPRFWMPLIALAVGLCSTMDSRADEVADTLGCMGGPNTTCIINNNSGGSVQRFTQAAELVKQGARKRVVVDGYCASACTIAADIAKERFCITQYSLMAFHKGTEHGLTWTKFNLLGREMLFGPMPQDRFFDPAYSPKIQAWIDSMGGLPADGRTITMPFDVARTIWKTCTSYRWPSTAQSTPIPRPRPH